MACVDSEQWVSMLAEMMKTFPSTGSLNVTEYFHNEDNNRIFNDLITDLKKIGMFVCVCMIVCFDDFNRKLRIIVIVNLDFMFLQ